jgi:xylulose-5-phosphate/fructose-6-phosphate phosphoketolase
MFTKDKPVVFAFHGYPWLIHRLTYKRANKKLHVRGYIEEGTITTAFDMTVMNKMDRFNLVIDVVDRLELGDAGQVLKVDMQKRLLEHKNYIEQNGIDMPEIENWRWNF